MPLHFWGPQTSSMVLQPRLTRTGYKRYSPLLLPHDFTAFVGEKVGGHADVVWTTGKVQCLHQGITPSMTRTLPTDTLLSNKSQPFSIVWADNTDSICDLPFMLTFWDNFKSKHHRTNATHAG
jgi:hypothetical protein